MTINKEITIDQITVTDGGAVYIRHATKLIEDDIVLSTTYHREVIQKDADVSSYPARVQTICNAAWME